MVDQLNHGAWSCARKAPDVTNNVKRQSVAIRARFTMSRSLTDLFGQPANQIYKIKKFLIIAESSCGRT